MARTSYALYLFFLLETGVEISHFFRSVRNISAKLLPLYTLEALQSSKPSRDEGVQSVAPYSGPEYSEQEQVFDQPISKKQKKNLISKMSIFLLSRREYGEGGFVPPASLRGCPCPVYGPHIFQLPLVTRSSVCSRSLKRVSQTVSGFRFNAREMETTSIGAQFPYNIVPLPSPSICSSHPVFALFVSPSTTKICT